MDLQLLSWLCIFVFYLNTSQIDSSSDINQCRASVPNIAGATLGYDPVMSNPLENPDPGLRNKIFEQFNQDGNNDVVLNSFLEKTYENIYCDSELTDKTFINYNQYKQATSSSHTFSFGADNIVKEGILRFSFEQNDGYGIESSSKETRIAKFFRDNNGEIIENKIQCITHVVNISPFAKPVFTPPFLAALRALNAAAKKPESESSKDLFSKFVRTYGTHFMSTTFLGAKMAYRNYFESQSVNARSKTLRTQCIANSVYGSIGAGFEQFISASASFAEASAECSYSSSNNAYFKNNSMSSASMISIGPLPIGSLKEWSATVRESPVPIFYKLDKISNMFTSDWFSTINVTDNGNRYEVLNGKAMYDFFELMSSDYCRLILRKDCINQEKGCGINSLCGPWTTCINEPDSDMGYRCEKICHINSTCGPWTTCIDEPESDMGYRCITKYGGVILAGGWKDVEAFDDTWTLPNLPYAAEGLTLSQIGTEVFACGGHTASAALNTCYRINITSNAASWKRLGKDIPTAMYYHTASVIGSHIWLVYRNALYDLDSVTEEFRKYNLPFEINHLKCAVSNSTHAYVIGAGSNQDEIWINSEASNPAKWHQVATMATGRRGHACLWLEEDIYITGGVDNRKDVEVLDTDTNTVQATGSLIDGRTWHGMMVLEDHPAVVGGDTSSGRTDTIETYNSATGQWTKSRRTLQFERAIFGLVQLQE